MEISIPNNLMGYFEFEYGKCVTSIRIQLRSNFKFSHCDFFYDILKEIQTKDVVKVKSYQKFNGKLNGLC